MLNLTYKLSLFSALFVVAGCASDLGQTLVKDEERIARFKKNETTKKDSYYLMGQPHVVLHADNGESCWLYQYTKTGMAPSSMIPILGSFVGGYTHSSQVISIVFDKIGIHERIQKGTKESTTLYYEGFNANDEKIKSTAKKLREGIREEMKTYNLPFDESRANADMGLLMYSLFGFGYKGHEKVDCDLTFIKQK